MKVAYTHEFPMGHRLMGHEGKCKHIHGHNYLVEVSYEGHVNEVSGFVLDFSVLKKAVREVLDRYDHAFVVDVNDPCLESLAPWGKVLVLPKPPTAENLAATWKVEIAQLLTIPYRTEKLKLRVYETRDCYAET